MGGDGRNGNFLYVSIKRIEKYLELLFTLDKKCAIIILHFNSYKGRNNTNKWLYTDDK